MSNAKLQTTLDLQQKVNINKMTRILHGVDKGKKKKILLVV